MSQGWKTNWYASLIGWLETSLNAKEDFQQYNNQRIPPWIHGMSHDSS